MRLKTRLELEEQRKENYMRRLQQRDDDEKFRMEQLRLLADSDKLEQLSNEKKRQKQLEHYKMVRQLIEERKARRDAELLKIIQENEEEIQIEKRRYLAMFLKYVPFFNVMANFFLMCVSVMKL